VFDGDNIFLAQQGERLAKNGLSYSDYRVSSSADTLSKIFRMWLDNAAEATRRTKDKHADLIVEAAVGVSLDGASPYPAVSQLSRRELLDRYESHTKNCKICSKALLKLEKKQRFLKILQPTLFGATGASFIALVLSTFIDSVSNLPSKLIMRMFGSSLLLSIMSIFLKTRTEKSIQKFYYQPHSHQTLV
jgi:hypothetical protein